MHFILLYNIFLLSYSVKKGNFVCKHKFLVIGADRMLYFFVLLAVTSLAYALIKKRFIFLTIPVAAMILYMAVKIIMVPLPLGETLKFIFGLR